MAESSWHRSIIIPKHRLCHKFPGSKYFDTLRVKKMRTRVQDPRGCMKCTIFKWKLLSVMQKSAVRCIFKSFENNFVLWILHFLCPDLRLQVTSFFLPAFLWEQYTSKMQHERPVFVFFQFFYFRIESLFVLKFLTAKNHTFWEKKNNQFLDIIE